MYDVSMKYFFYNKKNWTFYFLLFILVLMLFVFSISMHYYTYKLILEPQDSTSIVVEIDDIGIKLLNERKIIYNSCYQIEKINNCQVPVTSENFDSITDILSDNDITYKVYDNTEDMIYFMKIRVILIVGVLLVFICLLVITVLLIKNKLNKENRVKEILNYLGANKKVLRCFDLNYVNILFFSFYIFIYCLLLCFLLIVNDFAFYLKNIVFINVDLFMIILLVYLIYLMSLRTSIRKIKDLK